MLGERPGKFLVCGEAWSLDNNNLERSLREQLSGIGIHLSHNMRVQVPTSTSTTPMQSTRPLPVLSQMSAVPTQSPIPSSTVDSRPHPPRKAWHVPRLLFQVKDVCHPGAVKFFRTTNTETLLREAVVGVLQKLYTYDTAPTRLASLR